MDSGDWVTLTDAARLVKRTRTALEKWATRHAMPVVRHAGETFVQMRYVHEWAAKYGRSRFDTVWAEMLFRQGLGCREIAREMGCDPGVVSRWAASEGHVFPKKRRVCTPEMG